jgi:carboxyl-terminal processing protease
MLICSKISISLILEIKIDDVINKMANMNSNKKYRQSIFIGIGVGIGLALAFGLGFLTSSFALPVRTDLNFGTNLSKDYRLLNEVQGLIEEVYLRELPEPSVMEYNAIRGMLEKLGDPTTFFIEPPVAQSESQALAGTYGGIGVQVKRIESGQFAIYPFVDSPAFDAGFRDDDILLAIDDVEVDLALSNDVIDQMLRGEVIDNNGVNIQVKREDEDIEAYVEFDVINIPSVISRVVNEDQRIGYIQILRFTNRTPDELDAELSLIIEQGVLALIIDLRNNNGGLLHESIEVADEFLDKGLIVIEQSRELRESFTADSGGKFIDAPLAILVNINTASASELVAGALRDNGRGILIGQTTYGKGTVQQIFPLSDGSSVHITSAEWLTPNEQTIASQGLIPDIVMIPDENNREIEYGEAVRYLQSILNKQTK